MPSLLFTDKYCLTMGQYFYDHKDNDLVSFELFVRRLPPDRGYMLSAGLGTVLWWLEHIEFGEREWQWMIDEGYDHSYVTWLYRKAQEPRFFTGDVWAIPEGVPIGANTPILRITAPRIEATIVESFVLSAMNHQLMVASKASRIVQAADDAPVWDFSLRRLHGPDAGIGVARAAYIAGCAGTATTEAGALLGIPTTGTMAHHYVQMRGPHHEYESFCEFLQTFPDRHALLVDTFDTRRGIFNAIRASRDTQIPLRAIRLDSGNLLELSRWGRQTLDDNERHMTDIMASNDLDEHAIARLVMDGAPIDIYGVGTMLGTVPDAPNVGGVYKLVEQHERNGDDRFTMKFAVEKSTNPGCHQVWRSYDEPRFPALPAPDVISLDSEDLEDEGYLPLMEQVMANGRQYRQPSLDEIRQRRKDEMVFLAPGHLALRNPAELEVRLSDELRALKERLTTAAEAV